ncbi:FeoA family protein [Capnocytophaga canimorsus]|uniref:Ferrous iron transport protein A n=1 Tax=Capnocytophaga canimorsus TaxID=28188 RepID=A0A0B7IRT7_9FLAO|nr:FeoA family protein [Capnocytophaga canimorsus]ATA77579.1 ferrous iron transport protein A [Capnocytophaga canimorsus]PJI82565.1 ferrous iron transport protein A [Capnocytophaga canimorsus]CEN37736.1 Ferrous iron transport protein A [Capnocytophaga canimorsus]CEN52722.1 Ferrous iron transport protein A [Capnocytophaga canimorsus]STA72853.1 FeoA domain [Capnocytophaga canimorsus]
MTHSTKKYISDLEEGQKAIIKDIDIDCIPLKIIELGCFPGAEVEMIQKATFNDPLYINIDGTYLSIRKEMAALIEIDNR